MKKLLAVVLCAGLLGACAPKAPTIEPTNAPGKQPGTTDGIRKMISPTDKNPIDKSYTALGEVGIMLGDEYVDIILATEAERGEDGYMMWDDTQGWTLGVVGESEHFKLFDGTVDGQMYIDVATENNLPVISLIHSSTVGMSVTKYTYTDGAFYQEELITPTDDGNNIYTSFPEYTE